MGSRVLATTTINIPSWGNASLIDVLWMCAGIAGLSISGWGLRGSIENMARLANQQFEDAILRQGSTIITRNYVMHDLLRVCTFTLVCFVGVIALTQGPPPGTATVTTPVGLSVAVLFFCMVIITGIHSYLDQRQRKQLRYLYSEGNNE